MSQKIGKTMDGKTRILCEVCRSKGEVPDETGTFKFKKCPNCGGKGWTETVEIPQ